MLLETHPTPDTVLFIDAPSAAGFDKGDRVRDDRFSPDKVLDNVAQVTAVVAVRLSEVVADMMKADHAPNDIELSFSVRVDSASKVSVAQNEAQGQFRVIARWNGTPAASAGAAAAAPTRPAAAPSSASGSSLFGKP